MAKNALSVSACVKLPFALHYTCTMLLIIAEKSRERHPSIVLLCQERSKYGARVLGVSTYIIEWSKRPNLHASRASGKHLGDGGEHIIIL